MNEDMKKFENVARYLDGEQIELDQDELALLAEFCQEESMVRASLSQVVQPELTGMVSEKLSAALAAGRAPRRTIRIFRWATAAAAAIVIITAAVFFQTMNSPDSTNIVGSNDVAVNVNGDQTVTVEEQINVFLKPLFYDETSQAILDTGVSEQDMIDAYFDEPDNVMMLTPNNPASA